jgi:hypothetical protein
MKMYTVVVDSFVTIHPSKGFNVIAADEYDAKEQAEELFDNFLKREYGWVDYDEIKTEIPFVKDLKKGDTYNG